MINVSKIREDLSMLNQNKQSKSPPCIWTGANIIETTNGLNAEITTIKIIP